MNGVVALPDFARAYSRRPAWGRAMRRRGMPGVVRVRGRWLVTDPDAARSWLEDGEDLGRVVDEIVAALEAVACR